MLEYLVGDEVMMMMMDMIVMSASEVLYKLKTLAKLVSDRPSFFSCGNTYIT